MYLIEFIEASFTSHLNHIVMETNMLCHSLLYIKILTYIATFDDTHESQTGELYNVDRNCKSYYTHTRAATIH